MSRSGVPLQSIGRASEALGVHPRTLMAYERIGLVRPARRSNRRHYSPDELRWLGCVQTLNREGGISLQGLSTMLRFVPCWAIRSELHAGSGPAGAAPPIEARLERVRRAYAGSAPEYCRDCGVYRENRGPCREALRTAGTLPAEPSS
ncbi:MAG: MerR family transcriptional regulator [Candidatus Eiseniibacteriota bacterium]